MALLPTLKIQIALLCVENTIFQNPICPLNRTPLRQITEHTKLHFIVRKGEIEQETNKAILIPSPNVPLFFFQNFNPSSIIFLWYSSHP